MTTPQPHTADPFAQTVDNYRRESNFARALRRPTPITVLLLASLLMFHGGLLFLGEAVEGRVLLPGGQPLDGFEVALMFGAKINALVREGEFWRLSSSGLLHGGWLHLVVNLYALFILGRILEKLYGSRRFLIIYTASGLCGAVASTLFTDGPSVGASGALFGLLGGLLVFGFKFRSKLPPRVSRAFGVGLLPWVALNLVFGFIPGFHLDNAAHIGGLLGGTLLALLFSSTLTGPPKGWKHWALEVGFLTSCLVLAGGLVFAIKQIVMCSGSGALFYQCHPAALLGIGS